MGSPASMAALMSDAAELVLPGVVKWMPLSVSDGVDLVGDGGEEMAKKVCGGPARDLLVQCDEGQCVCRANLGQSFTLDIGFTWRVRGASQSLRQQYLVVCILLRPLESALECRPPGTAPSSCQDQGKSISAVFMNTVSGHQAALVSVRTKLANFTTYNN